MSRFLTDLMSKPRAAEKARLEIVLPPAPPEKPQTPENSDTYSPPSPAENAKSEDWISMDKYAANDSEQNEPAPFNQTETSPSKNFTKTSNSIVRLAIPEKYFRGQSKHTYDVLYGRTRGAVVPVRQVQLLKTELVKLTGLAEKTVQLHIRYLRDSKLINVYPQMGSRNGWVYEVFVPEEVDDLPEYKKDWISMDKISMDKTMQNLSSKTMQNLSILVHTNPLENKGLNPSLKTSFKDNTKNDDDNARVREAFAGLANRLDAAARKITGRGASKSESEEWARLADLLILELEIAASRADGISSVPAFLTEVLRRQFFSSRRAKTLSAESPKTKIDAVGKAQPNSYEIKALGTAGRKAALEELREFADDDFLKDFQKWYTAADWSWLIQNLEKDKKPKN